MSEDIHALSLDLQLTKFFLLGHSMGGKVAMHYALRYPDRVSGLMVADIGPVTYQKGHDAIFEAMRSLPLAQITDRKDADDLLAASIDSYGIRQFILKNLSRSDTGQYEWKLNLEAIVGNYDSLMGFEASGQFKSPVLFLKGSASEYIRLNDWAEYLSYFPVAKLMEIEGAGHWIHAEKPDEVYEAVRHFILAYS